MSDEVEPAPCWGLEFEMGRRCYDAQYSAAWHELVALFVLIERAREPVYRLLLRERASAPRQDPGAEIGPGATRVALETALGPPASAEEMDSMLRSYVVGIPDAVIRAINLRPELLGPPGPGVVEPLGVLPGIVFASCRACLVLGTLVPGS